MVARSVAVGKEAKVTPPGSRRATVPTVEMHSSSSGHLGFAPPRRPDPTSAVFGALADPTRRAIIESLFRSGEATATQLAEVFPVTRQAVTKHLVALADAGLVSTERVGREQRYHLVPSALAEAKDWIMAIGPTPAGPPS